MYARLKILLNAEQTKQLIKTISIKLNIFFCPNKPKWPKKMLVWAQKKQNGGIQCLVWGFIYNKMAE